MNSPPYAYPQALLGLAAAWDNVAFQCGGQPSPGSQAHDDARALPGGVESRDQLVQAIAQAGVVCSSASAQCVRSLATLFGPGIVVTGWAVTRTIVEHCSRVGWLLADSEDLPATNRAARFFMEAIASTQIARLAAGREGRTKEVKALKETRDRLLGQAKTLDPEASLFKSVEQLSEWSIAGNTYVGLGKAVADFGKVHLGRKGLYANLSSYTHPSLSRLNKHVASGKLEDRTYRAFIAPPEVIHEQLAVGCSSLYRAASLVVNYEALDGHALEAWANEWPDLLLPNAADTT